MSNYLKIAVVSWEKLRIVYNGVLLTVGVLLLWFNYSRLPLNNIEIDLFIILVAVVANLCYFLGPICEMYSMAYTGRAWPDKLRITAFSAGLAFSALSFVFMILAAIYSPIWALG